MINTIIIMTVFADKFAEFPNISICNIAVISVDPVCMSDLASGRGGGIALLLSILGLIYMILYMIAIMIYIIHKSNFSNALCCYLTAFGPNRTDIFVQIMIFIYFNKLHDTGIIQASMHLFHMYDSCCYLFHLVL